MANRQNAGKGRVDGRVDVKQNFEQNQLGLKEAFAILQRDFLELKKAYIGKEQELVEIQERYFMLEQSYQDLQQECQDQQAKLVKQLEKSYEAYNEKFVRVEELEGKLRECNKNLEKINQHKENQENAACIQEQIHFFEETVKKSLENVGLSLAIINGDVEIKILDDKKFKQSTVYKEDVPTGTPSKNLEATQLGEQNVLLQQTLLSLKTYTKKQHEQLTRTNEMLKKKSEECLKLKKGTQWEGSKGTIVVETKALQGIVFGLSELSDFIVQLKKSICDQNSWIDVLSEALNENKKFHEVRNKTAVAANFHGATGQNSVGGKKNKSKKKSKSAGGKAGGKLTDNCSPGVSEIPSSDEILEEARSYVIVPPVERSVLGRFKTAESNSHSLPTALSTGNRASGTFKSLHHQPPGTSSLNLSEKRKASRSESREQPPRAVASDNIAKQKHDSITDEMCPVCNLIFEKNCGLKKRTSHINSHFED